MSLDPSRRHMEEAEIKTASRKRDADAIEAPENKSDKATDSESSGQTNPQSTGQADPQPAGQTDSQCPTQLSDNLETVLQEELSNQFLQPVQKKPRTSSDIPFSRFSSPHDFHHVLNDWAMQSNFAFTTGKERNSDRSIAITYTCCRSNVDGKACTFEVRGKKRKDEDFWTLHKVDVKGTGHNHPTGDEELSADQQSLVDLAERQRLCDIPSFYHSSLPPRFVAYSSSDALYTGLNDWARHQGFFFRLGTNWATKSGNENQTYYCGISGCSYSITGIRLAGQKSWAIRSYNARHVEHNHEGASVKNREQVTPVSLPPIADKYASFSALHEALNGWSVTKNFAFKTGTSSTGHTNGLVSKYMVCCMASDTGDPCEYSIIVKEAKDGTWAVSQAIKARKEHNHSLEDELTGQQQLLLEAAETRRIIQMPEYAPEHLPSRTVTFPDREKLFLHLEKFAKARNFRFAIKRSKKEKNGRLLVNYECAKTRKSATKCPYHVYARENKDGVWSVSYPYNLKNEHNHDLTV